MLQPGPSQQDPYSSSVPGVVGDRLIIQMEKGVAFAEPAPEPRAHLQHVPDIVTAAPNLKMVCSPSLTGLLLRHTQCSRLFPAQRRAFLAVDAVRHALRVIPLASLTRTKRARFEKGIGQ